MLLVGAVANTTRTETINESAVLLVGMMTALVGSHGLIFLDPRDARLKQLAAPLYAAAARQAQPTTPLPTVPTSTTPIPTRTASKTTPGGMWDVAGTPRPGSDGRPGHNIPEVAAPFSALEHRHALD